MELRTEIVIEKSVEEVWKVLTDFASYEEWNPFINKLIGKVEVGSQIEIRMPGMRFKPRILVFSPHKELRWLGHLWIKGLFDGEHVFQLEEIDKRTTRLVHSEKFSGIFVPFLKRKLNTETRAGFESMNRSLKERVERG